MKAAPARPPSNGAMEGALLGQSWGGVKSTPTHTAQTGPHLPLHLERAYAGSPVPAGHVGSVSGAYRTISEQREASAPRSDRAPVADDGWPLGYIVASAFFLAIAVVGFGLWLAFEVIAL